MNKYGAIRTEVDNITFASRHEALRYIALKTLVRAGAIKNLELQPTYQIEINGIKVCKVKLDFQYWDNKLGKLITEDAKGMDYPISRLKRKLVFAQYGVEVVLV